MKLHTSKIVMLFALKVVFALNFASAQEKPPSYFGIQIGTLGAGLQYVKPLNSRWDLRASATFLKLTKNRETISSTLTTKETIEMRTGGLGIIADYCISKNTPNWKIAFGAIYQFNKITDSRQYDVEYNDSKVDLGNLSLEFTTFPVSPYAGFMWGNFKSEKKIIYCLELGTLYHGKPKVLFTGEGRIAPTAELDEIVSENVKDYNWYPYLNFQINYKLK